MSRILGVVANTSQPFNLVGQTLRRVFTQKHWEERTTSSQNCTLGYIGNVSNNLWTFKGVSLVLDGFLYNYKDLDFADEPVGKQLILLYLKFGIQKFLQIINGDFSILLFDANTNEFYGIRDRIGIRPFYYTKTFGLWAFASAPNLLLSLPDVRPVPNEHFVARFAGLHYRYIDNEPSTSPYKNINQLPAGHFITIRNGVADVKQYWGLRESGNFQLTRTELAEQYRELLMDAVKIRANQARKPVFTLSGGMDSSSVLASAVRMTGNKQEAVSTIYEDKTYDESEEIQSMLAANVSKWHAIKIGDPEDIFSIIQKMVKAHAEPIATATWLSHYLLCERMQKMGFESIFGGLGGDELNAGEYEYFFYHFADLKQKNKISTYHQEIKKWAEYHNHPIFKKDLTVAENYFERVIKNNAASTFRPEQDRLSRYTKAINKDFYHLDTFQPKMEFPFESYLKNRTYQDIFFETAPCCLRAEDRQSLAFGLDNFVPFFDYRLVEFMFKVDGIDKIENGVTKVLLREAMKGVLPDETRTRIAKSGWNAPAHIWFSGKNKETLLDLVHSQSFRERGIYDMKEVLRLIHEHDDIISNGLVKENHMMFLWQMVNMELWMQSQGEYEENKKTLASV